MKDQYGRNIDYMRVSVTDRCNLRCRYCMPHGAEWTSHADILRYEEILRICRQAVALGITNFKITGGEPLVRKGCATLIRQLKALPGVRQVTLTTNGLLLAPLLDELCAAGLDGVNISLDTLRPARFAALTGTPENALAALPDLPEKCLAAALNTKINTVLLAENRDEWVGIAGLAQQGADVRFIELMPIGAGADEQAADPDTALAVLREAWPDLAPVAERRGNGPAHYYASKALRGRIGVIDAVSHRFCAACNRVRLTSTGRLKPCLCYEDGADLRAVLRGGGDDAALRAVMEDAIFYKPRAHCFARREDITEHNGMSRIGG